MIFQMIPADMYFTSCIYESRVLPVKPFNKRFFPTTLVVLFNEFWETENSLLLIWLCRSSGIINRITTRPREPPPPPPPFTLAPTSNPGVVVACCCFFFQRARMSDLYRPCMSLISSRNTNPKDQSKASYTFPL